MLVYQTKITNNLVTSMLLCILFTKTNETYFEIKLLVLEDVIAFP